MEEQKSRSDKGKSRSKYTSTIHPKYKSHLMRCNRDGLETEFSEEDYLQAVNQPCYYCGSVHKVGIIRRDYSEGYTFDNTRPACYNCSMLKSNHWEREFIDRIKIIHKHLFPEHLKQYHNDEY